MMARSIGHHVTYLCRLSMGKLQLGSLPKGQWRVLTQAGSRAFEMNIPIASRRKVMITITNLSKNFDERMLLDNVSLSIFPNERIGLTGPNGAGKSTLFQIILGQMEPSSGIGANPKGP